MDALFCCLFSQPVMLFHCSSDMDCTGKSVQSIESKRKLFNGEHKRILVQYISECHVIQITEHEVSGNM